MWILRVRLKTQYFGMMNFRVLRPTSWLKLETYTREREEGGHTRASIMRLKWYGWRLARWVVSYNASAMGCRGGLP